MGRFEPPGVRFGMRDGAPEGGRGQDVALLGIASALLATFLAAKHLAWLPAEFINPLIAAAAGAGSAAALVLAQSGRRRSHDLKIASELEGFAQRLLRLEAQIASLNGAGSKADSTLTDMEGDVHSLSQVVRSLAETVTGQESEIRKLKRTGAGLSYQSAAGSDRPAAPLPVWSSFPSFLPAREDPDPPPREEPPPSFAGTAPIDAAAIRTAAIRGDIDLHVMPLLTLPQRSERAYAAYPMLEVAGAELLGPSEYGPILERSGDLPALVGTTLVEGANLGRRLDALGGAAPVLVAIGDGVLDDLTLIARLEALSDRAPASLVLQVSQFAFEAADPIQTVLARLRGAGTTFALTEIQDINLNPAALARRGVRYVLIPSDLLLDEAEQANFAALVAALSEAGIDTVATDVDDEAVVPELLDLGLPMAQGLGLALPYPADTLVDRLVREVDDLAPAVRTGAQDGPLRDFLRRAQ